MLRSLQFTLAGLPVHNEENPDLHHPRHPIVVYCHLAYISLLILVSYLLWGHMSPGLVLYILIKICLYNSSAAYHTWRPSRFLRFVDQTMISWYVIVIPMPLIYHEPWALPMILSLMTLSAISKWYGWEEKLAARISWLKPKQAYLVGALFFFATGSLSFALVVTFGFAAIGVDALSWTGFWIVVATTCFIGKLYFYTSGKGKLIWNVWETPESGHCILSVGASITSLVFILNPV